MNLLTDAELDRIEACCQQIMASWVSDGDTSALGWHVLPALLKEVHQLRGWKAAVETAEVWGSAVLNQNPLVTANFFEEPG